VPTPDPSSVPTYAPSFSPTVSPTVLPSGEPTGQPTIPFRSPGIIFGRSNFDDEWPAGVELIAWSPRGVNTTYAPGPGNNPFLFPFVPDGDGLVEVATTFVGTPPDSFDEHDLKCQVYWNITIEATGMVYHGTFNTTFIFSYDTGSDTWDLVSSDNAVDGYTACAPSAAPTGQPTIPFRSPGIIFGRSNFDDEWPAGVELIAWSPRGVNTTYAPGPGNNPFLIPFVPDGDGLIEVTTTFVGTPPDSFDEHDLKCQVYWNITIEATGMVYHGTFNTTFIFSYDTGSDTWDLVSSDNAVDGYTACAPSAAPTGQPTIPFRSPGIIFGRSNFDDEWPAGVELIAWSPRGVNTTYAPGPGNNPFLIPFVPDGDGLIEVTTTFVGTPPDSFDEHDLKCQVYWNITIEATGMVYHGTFNTTFIFSYDTGSDTWDLVSSDNAVNGYVPCVPTATPTAQPSRQPTAEPSAAPTCRPTVKPSSSRPTNAPSTLPPTPVPTLHPTGVPTTVPTYRPTPINFTNATIQTVFMRKREFPPRSNTRNWGNAKFFFFDPMSKSRARYQFDPSSVVDNPASFSFKPNITGVYMFTVQIDEAGSPVSRSVMEELMVKCYWEVNLHGLELKGTFNTTYLLDFNAQLDIWTLLYSENEVSGPVFSVSPTPLPSHSPTANPTLVPNDK
jgi:hypothetical protein